MEEHDSHTTRVVWPPERAQDNLSNNFTFVCTLRNAECALQQEWGKKFVISSQNTTPKTMNCPFKKCINLDSHPLKPSNNSTSIRDYCY